MFQKECPQLRFTSAFGKKWTYLILSEMDFQQEARFGQLHQALKPISAKVLVQRLRLLENQNLIENKKKIRKEYGIYFLTPLGMEMMGAMEMVKKWAIEKKKLPSQCLETNCNGCRGSLLRPVITLT